VRWQSVSPTLMRHLLAHWEEPAHGDPCSDEPLFRHRNGGPIIYRRYDGARAVRNRARASPRISDSTRHAVRSEAAAPNKPG
jgi:hypothetical protein